MNDKGAGIFKDIGTAKAVDGWVVCNSAGAFLFDDEDPALKWANDTNGVLFKACLFYQCGRRTWSPR